MGRHQGLLLQHGHPDHHRVRTTSSHGAALPGVMDRYINLSSHLTHPRPIPNRFGDLTPASETAKAVTIVFALVGVSLVALSVGEISNYLIEKHDEQVRWVRFRRGEGVHTIE